MADAVRDHYKPVGPADSVPREPVTVAVALADKLDTLVGFFGIDEKPTGSKDPYALRRAALGVIRLVLENGVRLRLRPSLQLYFERSDINRSLAARRSVPFRPGTLGEVATASTNDLLAFFADRLKVQLRDEGRRHDLVDAVFALGDDDLVRIVARVEALSGFLATEDGANLLAGIKRATNILRAEAKKHPDEVISPFLDGEGSAPEELALAQALSAVAAKLEPLLAAEDFAGAMTALARLRGPVDAFFERVLVNDPAKEVRLRRLRLLSTIQAQANRVADFSLIQG